jgi:hypothetical protein
MILLSLLVCREYAFSMQGLSKIISQVQEEDIDVLERY